MKYRKAEQMLKNQGHIGNIRHNDKKKSVLESGELSTLINNLGVTKNNLLKDIADNDSRRKASFQRKYGK